MQRRTKDRGDHEVLVRLDEEDGVLGRSPEDVAWYADEVQKGIDAADAGLTKSHAQVGAVLKDAGIDLDQPAPAT